MGIEILANDKETSFATPLATLHKFNGFADQFLATPSQGLEDKFLKIVKNITSKGFIRSNYEEKLVDLSDVRINLKTKN